MQTDAKISPVNYGGPIIDIQGRVQGILIPASPQVKDDGSMDETAGFEWYDSGIGFAIPFEDVLDVLPRLKQGKDLKARGRQGAGRARLKTDDMLEGNAPWYGKWPRTRRGQRAGLKAGDVIIEVDGQPTLRMAQFRHVLGRKYDGDKVSLKFKRGAEVIELKDVELSSTPCRWCTHPFLGILPMRDDPRLGVEVRFVYPKSPADKVGPQGGRPHRQVRRRPRTCSRSRGRNTPAASSSDFLNTAVSRQRDPARSAAQGRQDRRR